MGKSYRSGVSVASKIVAIVLLLSTASAGPAPDDPVHHEEMHTAVPAPAPLSEAQPQVPIVPVVVAPGPAAHPTTAAPDPPEEPVLVISAVGDVTLGDPAGGELSTGFHTLFDQTGRDHGRTFSGVIDVLAADDLTIANLEGTLTTAACRADLPFSFRGRPEFARILQAGSVEVVSLANNHSFDCDSLGLRETRTNLRSYGVGYFGLGDVDVRLVESVEVVNIGYFSGTMDIAAHMAKTVRTYERDDNLVIVSFHGGIEGSHDTTLTQHDLAHQAIDAGADLVLGHHPHVLQGIEHYKGKPIVYSLGNFVFGGDPNPPSYETMIFQARYVKRAGEVALLGWEILPAAFSGSTKQNDYRPVLLSGDAAERVRKNVARYSAALAKSLLDPLAKPAEDDPPEEPEESTAEPSAAYDELDRAELPEPPAEINPL